MTALLPIDLPILTDDAYEAFWHATEDDVGVTEVHDGGPEPDDVYSTYVEAIEA